MVECILEVAEISKSFPGVKALQDVSLTVHTGEVHVVLGENGAGKSTLMKILTGVYQPDAGSIILRGKHVEMHDPMVARQLGISIIYQEFNLFPHLSVAQNIFIGREPRYLRYILNERKLHEEAKKILDTLRYTIDPGAKVSTLSVAEQQMVEIAKAVSVNCDILIMDEPTSTLSEEEIAVLFETVHSLRAQQKGIIYISHRLAELENIADRVTVLRDGMHIRTCDYKDTNLDELIRLMVGREIDDVYPARIPEPGVELLRVEGLTRIGLLKDISFHVNTGEVLGVAGLVGAGRTETMRAIFGADPREGGKILIEGKEVQINSPHDAIEHGIGYLTEDRKRNGLALNLNIQDNIIMAHIQHFSNTVGIMHYEQCRTHSHQYVDALRIKTPNLDQIVTYLSGGNQQKVIIARWLCTQCKILIFDEPTRGIDVGAKREIYELIYALTARGTAIIMVSSELNEIVGMSDRILVMHSGKIAGFLNRGEATQEKIIALATGHTLMEHC